MWRIFSKSFKLCIVNPVSYLLPALLLVLSACGDNSTNNAVSATATPSSIIGSFNLPNTEMLSFPADVQKVFTNNMPSVKDPVLAYYGSTEDVAILAKNVDKFLTSNNYSFAVPNQKTLTESSPGSGMYFGIYTKPGAPDVLMTSMSTTKLPATLNTGFTDTQHMIVLDTLKGKKSFLALFSGTGLAQARLATTSNSAPTPKVSVTP